MFIIRCRVDKLMVVPLTRSSRSDALSRIPGKSTNVSGGAAGHDTMRQILSMQPAGGLTVSRSCLHNSGCLHWLLHYLLSERVHLLENCAFKTTAQRQCEAQGITRSSTSSSPTLHLVRHRNLEVVPDTHGCSNAAVLFSTDNETEEQCKQDRYSPEDADTLSSTRSLVPRFRTFGRRPFFISPWIARRISPAQSTGC